MQKLQSDNMEPHAFDSVLDLEEQFYTDGFNQGVADGVKAGQIEGRTFGLEKGFEKYVQSGRLHGKSLIWANRVPQLHKPTNADSSLDASEPPSSSKSPQSRLHPLSDNQRLAKHLKVLHALAESETLSTENTEEAVSDFDDRLKRAQAKAKIIERMIGDQPAEAESTGKTSLGS